MDELDPIIHGPKRLRIMAILSAAEAEAAYLQERLSLTAPDLSKQVRQLIDAGYVRANKTGRGPGSTTWYRMTREGRRAYLGYVETLKELIGEGVTE